MTPIDFVLVVGVLIACWTDLRTMLIPNWLNVTLMVCGAALHITDDPALPWLGMAAALAVHYPLWRLGVEKGGDAKLMIAIGALLGWYEMLEASLWYAILYIPVGLAYLAVLGRLPNLWRTFGWSLTQSLEKIPEPTRTVVRTWMIRLRLNPKEPPNEPTMMKTAPVIAVAAIAARWGDLFGWLGI
jgi:hypothetical protein